MAPLIELRIRLLNLIQCGPMMDTRAFLKLTGLLGFIVMIIAGSIYVVYVVIPAAAPLIKAKLSSEGISISQGEISTIMSIMDTIIPIVLAIASFIAWLISSAVLWALLKAFKINNRFMETWLLTGNAFYLSVVQTAVTAATPLLKYAITIVVEHKTQPPLLAIGLAFALLSAVLLAYIFSRAYGVGMARTLAPTLVASLIFWAISAVA